MAVKKSEKIAEKIADRVAEKQGYYEASKNNMFFDFPVTVFAGNILYNGMHWHEHLEILLCKRGQILVRAGGRESVLNAGDFITIGSGIPHEITSGEEGGLQIICSVDRSCLERMDEMDIDCSSISGELSARETDEIIFLLGRMAYISSFSIPKDMEQDYFSETDASKELLKQFLQNHPLAKEENRLLYQAYQYRFLAILSRHKRKGKEGRKKQLSLISDCIRYINEHIGEEIDAQVLADLIHVSQPTIYRMFRERLEMSLGDYITSVRLEAVCRYLQMDQYSITECAYICGFSSLSNFYRVFQREIGINPKDYRKQNQLHLSAMQMQQPSIMSLNRFENFYQMGIEREELLAESDSLREGDDEYSLFPIV